jgi:hypothetical protein
VDPNSLTAWCRTLLDEGKHQFYCPELFCKEKWEYFDVKKYALLNVLEIEYFEKKINLNFLKNNLDYKECLKCKSLIERIDLTTVRTSCLVCEKVLKVRYEFCWNCERSWPLNMEDNNNKYMQCGRINCISKQCEVLFNCKFIKLKSCPNIPEIPSIRACVRCGKLIEHTAEACKNGRIILLLFFVFFKIYFIHFLLKLFALSAKLSFAFAAWKRLKFVTKRVTIMENVVNQLPICKQLFQTG